MDDDELKYLRRLVEELQEQIEELKEQIVADSEASENEFELVWDAVNEIQGEDPEKLGEPIEGRKHSAFGKAKKFFTAK